MNNIIKTALLLLAIVTALDAAAGYGSLTYNGIKFDFYFSGTGENAVGDYAQVAQHPHSFTGPANIPASVTYEYQYVSGYDSQGDAIFATRNLTAPVTIIGEYAFDGCRQLTSVTIPNTVTTIGKGAFRNCYNMESATIPSSVTSIPENGFAGCSSLTNVVITNL